MKNQMLIAVGAILIVSALVFGLKINKAKAPALTEETSITTTTVATTTTTTTKSEIKTTLSRTAWTVFQNYLSFAEANNLTGIKSLSYQLSPTCADEAKTEECNALMDNAYFFGKDMKEKDFTNIWSDSKQIILSTDFQKKDVGTTTVAYTREIIYFIQNSQGSSKILYFSPEDGVIILRKDLSDEEIDTRIRNMTKDSDQDGLPDTVETCAGYAVEANCPNKITDPNKRDTNGNGFWDGIEIFFKK